MKQKQIFKLSAIVYGLLLLLTASPFVQAQQDASVGRAGTKRVSGSAPAKNTVAEKKSSGSSGFFTQFRLSYDLGLSTGRVNQKTYTEVDLGLNARLNPYFAIRNAVWGRFGSNIDSVYGLDTSARGILSEGIDGLGFTAFAGPGFRFPSRGRNVPFAEAGLVIHLGGLNVGGGVKSFFNNWVEAGADRDTQYFIILSGGGSL